MNSELRSSEDAWWWSRDVALEMWVDVQQVPINIRLAGTLDEATAADFVAVVEELIADGARDFDLQTCSLRVADTGGMDALMDLHRIVQRSGGRITNGGSVIDRTCWTLAGTDGSCAAGDLGAEIAS